MKQDGRRLIFKLHTKLLKKAKWNLSLDMKTAMLEMPESIVSVSNSQVSRWIDELNGVKEPAETIKELYEEIRRLKRLPGCRDNRQKIREAYERLYGVLFQKDYVCVVMDTPGDYDRANMGFTVNGIRYVRLVGTNGGVKTSTIIYINEKLYPEIQKRIDNGRDKGVKHVPAKLESYMALVCSGSVPLPPPRGFIVVHDVMTTFKDSVIVLKDEAGEPKMTEEPDYEYGTDNPHDSSDGYGMMTPEYARKCNAALNGISSPLPGMNTRYAFEKGMLYTFDFVAFGGEVAGRYEILDAWGQTRDVRDADVILTTSMLKLWDSYPSMEEYLKNCEENRYLFSAAKTVTEEIEFVRDTNYQFLQDIDMTDEDIEEFCRPCVDELNDIMGMDWRKSIVFLAGASMTDANLFFGSRDTAVRALMADGETINDAYIRNRVKNMLRKRIEMAKRGALRIRANFAPTSGDPYGLCQSMFGMTPKGLLGKGEGYHSYWVDLGADEILAFRAPMTCRNNIRRIRLNGGEAAKKWYRYMKNIMIHNAWDTACDAMNGADYDGDLNFTTNNPVLLRRVKAEPTIVCVQRTAEKKIPEEKDFVKANKLAFNDEIGIITNHVTSMIEKRAGFDKSSKEYETLTYRIRCGQKYQQDAIDRIKGIVSKKMPSAWYSYRDCVEREGDTEEEAALKAFNRRIVASEKPYFMIYVYPELKKKYKTYIANCKSKAIRLFSAYGIKSVDDLYMYEPKTREMNDFLKYYVEHMPVGNHLCTVNRIAKHIEKSVTGRKRDGDKEYDWTRLKSGAAYSRKTYGAVERLYGDYKARSAIAKEKERDGRLDRYAANDEREMLTEFFKRRASEVCQNEDELCDILVDMCYRHGCNKSMAWDIAGDTMVKNLLKRSGGRISYPVMTSGGGEFEFGGMKFEMHEAVIGLDNTEREEVREGRA